ncbi:MAG: alpha-ketoacid dehydrogenase subunit beta [Acidimicrobiia bacterium]|nr:MAG: alpha-ketoacid dehydrogenase subunit beta [Acidimicrobiia bacterium]
MTPTRRIRFRRALNEALREELERDPSVFLMGEDLREPWGGTYKVTQGLSDEFGPERILNTPISEGAIVGAALGAAVTGLRPVVELMYLDFALLASDQIVNQAAKIRYMTGGQCTVPLTIRTQGGGYKSSAAQHGQSLEAWFAHVPGLLVALPSNPADAKGLLKTAIRLDDPVLFIEHKDMYLDPGEVPDVADHLVPFGKAAIKREGTDVTVVAWSKMVGFALEAAEALAEEGVSVEVVDLRTLVPLDEETVLTSVAKTGRLVVVHEAHRRAGFGGEIAAIVAERAFDVLKAPILRVASRDVPIPMAPNLERFVLPSVADISLAVRQIVGTAARTSEEIV